MCQCTESPGLNPRQLKVFKELATTNKSPLKQFKLNWNRARLMMIIILLNTYRQRRLTSKPLLSWTEDSYRLRDCVYVERRKSRSCNKSYTLLKCVFKTTGLCLYIYAGRYFLMLISIHKKDCVYVTSKQCRNGKTNKQ